MARRTAAGLALAVLSLSCAGCDSGGDPVAEPTADPIVSVEDAQQTYSPLMSDLAHAIADATSQATPSVEREVVYFDGALESCAYSAHLTFPGTVFGSDVSWDAVRDAAESAVSSVGLELTGQLDVPGGYNGFDARAADGTVIEVRSKTADPSTVSITAPVTGSCPGGSTGQTLEPLDQ